MRLFEDWKPGEMFADDVGHPDQSQEEGRDLPRRRRGGQVSQYRGGSEQDVKQTVHSQRSLPLPSCYALPLPPTCSSARQEKPGRYQGEDYDPDRLVQLIEEKLCQQISERHNDHDPADRAPEQYEPGGPPVQSALRRRPPE